MSRRDFAMQQGTGIVVPAMATRARCPILCRVLDIVAGRNIPVKVTLDISGSPIESQ